MQHLPAVVPLYTAAEMRVLDRVAVDEVGIPGVVLMERAGLGAAAEILGFIEPGSRIAVVCGSGNNGGDGFVVARHLEAAGHAVEVLLVEAESKIRREPRTFLGILRQLEIPVRRVNVTGWRHAFDEADVIVDAMLGTGASGAPRPPYEAAMRAVGASSLPVVSLDVPSGVDASDGTVESIAVRADVTITFHAPKVGLAIAPGRFHAGRVRAIDIGVPVRAESPSGAGMATADVVRVVPSRPREANKYAASVLCIGGSTGMAGAISLVARATLRAGAGLAWGMVPDAIAADLDAAVTEVQFRGCIDDDAGRLSVASAEQMEELVGRAGAVVFGPGVGDSEQVRALSRWVARRAGPLVLDAQGLTAFSGDTQALAARDGAPTLLTPHEGELAKLLEVSAEDVRARRLHWVREAARSTRATVLLKGEDTIVCAPDGNFIVAHGHVAQATAGTGDVLSGVAGALLARGLDPLLAGTCAATACGLAASAAAATMSDSGVIASDLLDHLPAALDGRSDPSKESV